MNKNRENLPVFDLFVLRFGFEKFSFSVFWVSIVVVVASVSGSGKSMGIICRSFSEVCRQRDFIDFFF